jgi:hypothetical protein
MRLSRRLSGVLLALVLAGVLAPTALAGRKGNTAPSPAVTAPAPVVAPAPVFTSMVDIEALR